MGINGKLIGGVLLLQGVCLVIANFASLSPPYTCTTTTTLCQPSSGDEAAVRPPITTGPSNSQGKPGKRGSIGPKGEKGDPCQCEVADEEAIDAVRKRMEKLEAENVELVRAMSSGSGRLGSASNPARSCFHLKQQGQYLSGIYNIRPNETLSSMQVFCDMDSAGGGWTLVASIHENNIDGKCTSGDLWSSDQRRLNDSNTGNGNWENFNTFGIPEAATSADYKSQAYSTLPASDLMIWHVPNDVEISRASEEAHMKYYTDTSFLENYGGNLRSLFKEHYPLEKREVEDGLSSVPEFMSAIVAASPSMVAQVPGFYNYNYDKKDSTNNYIGDGGGDMFDGGNKVYYQIGSNTEIWITYDQPYRNAIHGVEFLSSSTQHPFHALMWIDNEVRSEQSYAIKVQGDPGADGDGYFATRTGTLTQGPFSLRYQAASVYGAEDSSICKVFYYITNAEWGSVVPSVTKSPWTSGTSVLNHGIVFNGAPRSFIVGYTLLSRVSGNEVTHPQIRSVLSRILTVLPSGIGVQSCNREQESLIQPVTYLTGSAAEMSERIPPSVLEDTSAGYIQFRAYNRKGFPNAICPGVKTTSCRPESVCIGGIDTISTDARACGDFAGWQGNSGDSPRKTRPSGFAKSLDDVNSSILIFTRKQE